MYLARTWELPVHRAAIFMHRTFMQRISLLRTPPVPSGRQLPAFVSADRAFFKNCRFLGFQDTLYTYGKQSRQYYEDCYIEGTVDFIFGWSTAVFNRCHIHSKRDGYVTAPSTDQGKKYGYVFYDCKLTASPEAKKVYLSVPGVRMHKPYLSVANWDSTSFPKAGTTGGRRKTRKLLFMQSMTVVAKVPIRRHVPLSPIS